MTLFDIIVLIVVGSGAVGGFTRGFVQEVLSLAAWAVAVIAIRYFHTPALEWVEPQVGSPTTAAIVAFVALLALSWGIMRAIARHAGERSRKSMLGPVDRVLGFGFGGLKGAIIVVLGFAILAMGYDTIWGEEGRPDWIRDARTYPVVNASTDALVAFVAERRATLRAQAAEEAAAADAAPDEET